jgi:hypothetical protein
LIFSNANILNESISTTVQMDVINTGVEIIAIAVSVWIGLNIYNNCKESSMEKEIKELEIQNQNLVFQHEKMLFLKELEKTANNYEISNYFYVNFKVENELGDIYSELVEIEKIFCDCCNSYERKNWKDCFEFATDVSQKTYQGLKKCKKEDNKLIYLYMRLRYADALFYKYISADVKRIEDMMNSIKKYEECIDLIDDENKELLGYMHNSIGYPYLIVYDKNHQDKGSLEKAGEELEKAVAYNPKGRYWQNLGAYYERKTEDTGNLIKAKKCYEEALKSPKLDLKIFNLLGAADLKIVDQEIQANKRFSENKTFQELDKSNIDPIQLQDSIINAYTWLDRAVKMTPEIVDVYYNFGKACLYYWFWIDKDSELMKKQAELHIDMALAKAPNNAGALYTKRNYYEIVGDIQKALEVNEILLAKNGDAKEAKKVYEEYLNKNAGN